MPRYSHSLSAAVRRLPEPRNSPEFAIHKRRRPFLGLTVEAAIRAIFGGHAFVAVVVLALITFFLFREGFGFFAQQREALAQHRQSGQELVDVLREQDRKHAALARQLGELRRRSGSAGAHAGASAAAAEILSEAYELHFADAILPLRDLAEELGELALDAKEQGAPARLAAAAQFTAQYPQIEATVAALDTELRSWLAAFPSAAVLSPRSQERAALTWARDAAQLRQGIDAYLAGLPAALASLRTWAPERPISWWQVLRSFFFGTQWLTASFWQDFYGFIPLLSGSLLVTGIALSLAVPLGLGAAIYLSQIATTRERKLIKPAIEFIAAIPSVVLGLFGIVVLGQVLRSLSQLTWLSWIPGFPYAERLNAFTAACLLALIAVPTIFTLAEDALGNVPRAFKEGSYALGASRMQTTWRVIVPSSLSGLYSAVLLGLGRVIGETMIVLLCAGNRIAIPDFTAGLGAAFQPVHTMTGLIAQEMGEVVPGTLHYRALFMLGLVLLLIALGLNYAAQRLLTRYRAPTLG